MKYIPIFFLFIVFFSFQACKNQEELPDALYNKWLHVFEEDSAGYRAYRPTDSKKQLPPAQGRQVYEIRPDHRFILHTSGPADRPIAYKGNWEKVNENKLKVSFEDEQIEGFSLQIIRLSPEQMYLKKE